MKILVFHPLACHLGFLGCYGNEWVATPNLDRLASEGIVFDRHYADVIGADNARSARMVGGRPEPHREIRSLDAWHDEVAHILDDLPIFAWLEGPSLGPPWSLPDDLLATYTEDDDVEPWPDPPEDGPIDPAELRRLQSTYAAVVTFADAQLGAIVEALESRRLLDETLLVFTASSGLALEARARPELATSLHEERVHLPLIMRFPDARHAGTHISALTQPMDLLPTFDPLLGIDPRACAGRDLGPLLRSEVDQVRPYAVTRADSEASLRHPRWLLQATLPLEGERRRPSRLYVQPDDRWEVNDLAPRAPEIVESLEKTLRGFLEGLAEGAPLRYPEFPTPLP